MTNTDFAVAIEKRARTLVGAALAATAATMICLISVNVARADQDCKSDLQKLADRRISAMTDLNALAKRGKGKLDPIQACPKLRTLVSAEGTFLDYLKKNKDWCQIPDVVIDGISTSQAKSTKFAAQACALVAQAKKMQEEAKKQAQNGNDGVMADRAPKLPSGPL